MGDSVTKYKDMNDREVKFTIDKDIKSYPKMSDTVKQLEKEYPIIAEEFKEILLAQYELFSQKMLSYGMGNISMGSNLETKDEVKFSLTSIWIRMNDKMNRLKNLVLLGNKNPLDNEPTMDSWVDLTNYGIIAQIVSKGKWKK
jgi:hypothetical protein